MAEERLDRWFTIPNCITYARFALIPVFVVMHLTGNPGWALGIFVGAAASDGIDGFLARVLNQRSKLGAILDPFADKLLVLSALVTLVIEDRIPLLLLLLILFRDGWIAFGALLVKHKNLDLPTSPSRIGKYATFSLALLVVLALVDQYVARSELLHAYTAVVGFIASLCVLISTIQYFARFGYLLFAPARPPKADTERATTP